MSAYTPNIASPFPLSLRRMQGEKYNDIDLSATQKHIDWSTLLKDV